jgi:protein-S-isoprenylcysteine O-methyltransferase Ste14
MVAMAALHFLLPVKALIPFPFTLLGIVPALLGVAASVAASNAFNRAETTVKPFEQPSALLTGGWYRFTRHPMYVGFFLLVLGIAVLLGSLTPFVVLLPFGWIMHVFMVYEERRMAETFGEAYAEYANRVRRWL